MRLVIYFPLIVAKKNSVVTVVRYFILIVEKEKSIMSVVSEDKQVCECSQIFHFQSSDSNAM